METSSRENPPSEFSSHLRRLEPILAATLMVLLLLRGLWLCKAAWNFTTDDAYITLRYARHLAEGAGIVWNVGESQPAEGYSNFLFVVLGALALKLEADPMLALKSLGALSLLLTSLVLFRMGRLWLSPLVACIPPALLLSFKGVAFWAVSGLETSVYQFLVAASVLAFLLHLEATDRDASSSAGSDSCSLPSLVAAAVLALLASLTRPEGPVVFVALFLVLLLKEARPFLSRVGSPQARGQVRAALKRLGLLGLPFLIPYLLYFGWRLSYFGRWLPNSVSCKAALEGDPWLLHRLFLLNVPWVIALACLQSPKRFDGRMALLLLIPLAYAGILYGADDSVAYYGRHFLASYALLCVAAAVGLRNLLFWPGALFKAINDMPEERLSVLRLEPSQSQPLEAVSRQDEVRLPSPSEPSRWFEIAGLGITLFFLLISSSRLELELAESASGNESRMEVRRYLANYLRARLRPDDWVLLGDAGLTPYLLEAKVLDAYCLNTPAWTQAPIHRSVDRFLDLVFQIKPRLLVVHGSRLEVLEPQVWPSCNVYPALVKRPEFKEQYLHEVTIGGDGMAYWLFRRVEERLEGPGP